MLALPPPAYFLQQLPPAAPDAGAHALHVAHDAPAVRMGTHGMVLFGREGKLYASHIPMFHPPHDVQLLLQVELTGTPGRDFSDGLYTLEPERFDLSELMAGKRESFRATVYRGNFEGGGRALQKDVTVRVQRVLHSASLKKDAPALAQLRYLVVGEGRDAFLVHTLSRAPDFDQVLRVRFERPLPKGVHVLELPRPNTPEGKLSPGAVKGARLAGRPVHLEVAQELSYLKGPDFTP